MCLCAKDNKETMKMQKRMGTVNAEYLTSQKDLHAICVWVG